MWEFAILVVFIVASLTLGSALVIVMLAEVAEDETRRFKAWVRRQLETVGVL